MIIVVLDTTCGAAFTPNARAQRTLESAQAQSCIINSGQDRGKLLAIVNSPLTPGERDVLAELARGQTAKEAGEVLGVDEKTVTTQLQDAKGKLGSASREGTIAKAIGDDLLPDRRITEGVNPGTLDTLTPRQRAIAKALADGTRTTLKQIGSDLGIAETTVKTHLGNALAKTGTRNQSQLAALQAVDEKRQNPKEWGIEHARGEAPSEEKVGGNLLPGQVKLKGEKVMESGLDCFGVTPDGTQALARPVHVNISTFSPGRQEELADHDCKHLHGDQCGASGSKDTAPCVVNARKVIGEVKEVKDSPLTPRRRELLTSVAQGEPVRREKGDTPIVDDLRRARADLGVTTNAGAIGKGIKEGFLPDRQIRNTVSPDAIADLTPRQHAVVKGMAEDRTSKEIGLDLGIANATVETHMKKARRITGAADRPQLSAMFALHEKTRDKNDGKSGK